MMPARRNARPDVPAPVPRRLRRALAACALAALAIAVPARAQVADAVLEVVVQDETGQSLPGVTVTATRPETGFTRAAQTSQAGTARVPGLVPGAYKVQLDLQGFASLVRENLVLRVGQTARLEATLKVAQIAETVTVTGEAPLVDVFKTDSSTNIVPEQIQDLPVADRDFQRLSFLTPGVQRERGGFRFIGGGPVIGAGGNASQATILVDGVDFTDSSLGLARVRFSQDAIGEFRVIANRFDTEVGNSSGGALSIVTKSGTNELRGSAFGFFRDDALRSQGEFERKKNNYSRQQYGFTLGGPITEDKTHFFTSFEQISEDSITLFRPGGAYASLAADVPLPLEQSLAFAGLDHTISPSQRLAAKFVLERYRLENFRVGGVNDVSSGQKLERDNWNLSLSHNWTPSAGRLNTLAAQVGKRKYDEPTNSRTVGEFFSLGNTLVTGGNLVGNLLGESTQWELRDTFQLSLGQGQATHDIKIGGALLHVKDRFDFPVWEFGALFYLTDTRALPLQYIGGTGSGDATITTDLISGFVQDDFRPRPDVTLSFGLRYDLDTAGNNPDFTHPLVPAPRGKDTNNLQPRFGFTWDVSGKGRHVVRGGVGLFTGRFLLVPAFTELQQNGVTGRIVSRRLNGALLGLPQFALNPANPAGTGLALAPDISLLDTSLVNPESTQATLGWTSKLGDTGLFFDVEGIYVKGRKELIIRDKNFGGNANPVRPNPRYAQVNTYTNEGRSEYKALVFSLNGTLEGGHLVTASLTVASKKNTNDDFSPALVDYPSDPANIAAEYGRSRADERTRVVLSGVFKLPWRLTLAPIYEYGSGQPWNRRLGYDFNGDGKFSDRAAGIPRFSEDGPRFSQLSLRLTKRVNFSERVGVDLIAEAFNVFNTVNRDVNSVQGGEFLSGPTVANPRLPTVQNPRYGDFAATLPPREIQLGLRLTF
jgi:hypothetical protein